MRPAALAVLLALSVGACHGASTPSGNPGNPGDAGDDTSGPAHPPQKPVAAVLIGSGGFGYGVGSAFPGASMPQGMAKVGPDTKGPWGTLNFLHCAGYWYDDDVVQGFSHLHVHGTGVPDYGVLTVMPTDAPATSGAIAGYESKLRKSTEVATPGFYGVTLERGAIAVEIAASTHAAHHRWTWPAGATAHAVIDLDKHLEGGSIKDAEVTLDPVKQELVGRLRTVGRLSSGFGGSDLFFVARTRQPWTTASTWSARGAPKPGTSAKGTGIGVALDFAPGTTVAELQVGLSFVSTDGARKNLDAELPTWDFEAEKQKGADAWAAAMGVVKVDGGDPDERLMLDGALYHSFLMPTIYSDVDGSYRGVDGAVHVASDFRFVSDMSLWDTYRTLHPFWSLVAPARARDVVRSLGEMSRQRGAYPRWPIGTGEAGTMIGASADVVIADAYLKGVTDFDSASAWATLRAAALDPTPPPGGRGGRDHNEAYAKAGYLPADAQGGSVSWTNELSQDDFALGNLARALGHDDDAAALLARSQSWRALFDPSTGYLWAKNADGSWAGKREDETAFDSTQFVEADAAQSLWGGALHDVDGLVALFGGKDKVVAALEDFFAKGKADHDALDPTDALANAGPRPYYWGGNEPDIHAAYVFALVGRPDLTQKWVRWAMHELYGRGAAGLPGNDDGGTMTSWWVFGALGVYPIVGSDRYVLGAPLFPHAEIAVSGGSFVIDAPGASASSPYVQSVTLDGAPVTAPTLRHADLHPGGRLLFTMGPKPSDWGR